MKKIYLIITISIISLLFVASCSILPGAGSNELAGTTWKLISYNGNIPLAGKDMTAEFDAKEIQGSASCNSYFGTYRLKGDQISISGLGWTEMACMDPEGIMEQEQTIMKMLSESSSYSVQGDKLQITTSAGELLIFQQFIGLD
jgi:heat shock protein HslJ